MTMTLKPTPKAKMLRKTHTARGGLDLDMMSGARNRRQSAQGAPGPVADTGLAPGLTRRAANLIDIMNAEWV